MPRFRWSLISTGGTTISSEAEREAVRQVRCSVLRCRFALQWKIFPTNHLEHKINIPEDSSDYRERVIEAEGNPPVAARDCGEAARFPLRKPRTRSCGAKTVISGKDSFGTKSDGNK
jgi:hypothetical protein